MNRVSDRQPLVRGPQRSTDVEHIAQQPEGLEEDPEHEDLLSERGPAIDLLHGLEDAWVLRIRVQLGRELAREAFDDAAASISEPPVPVSRPSDLPPRELVDGARFWNSQRLVCLGEVETDVTGRQLGVGVTNSPGPVRGVGEG